MKKNYFDSLNYTIGNEDTTLELEILPEEAQHVFAVAGSGSRIIPLLVKNPRFITCIDSSKEQLSISELRIATLRELNYEDFLAFWGYPYKNIATNKRKSIFDNLVISSQAREIMNLFFERNNWESLLYAGKWEQTFKKLSRVNRIITKEKGLGIFNCQTEEEQAKYFKLKFPRKAWSFVIFLLGNAVVFNNLLYKGTFPKKNISESLYSFYIKRFNYLFKQDLARKNYFLQLLFFGELRFPEGLPLECNKETFLKAKSGLQKTQIKYILGDVITEASKSSVPIDFLSLSDIPSYLKAPREQDFLQEIKKNISTGGIIVNRYYLRYPENLNTDGYQNITDNFKDAISKEKIQMYSFGIHQKI